MKKKIHNYKVIKIIELVLFVILELIFLFLLIKNKTMRSSVFLDKSVFTLCALMYFTVLVSLIILIYDFITLKNLKVEDHKLEKLAYLDRKTGIPNRTSVNLLFDTYTTPESLKGIGCVVSEIRNIKEINAENGKDKGDRAIMDFSKLYEKSAEGFGFVGRNGGNEYITVIEKCDNVRMSEFFVALDSNISKYNETPGNINLDIHSEYVLFDQEEVSSFSDLVSKAYKKLGR